MGWLSAIKAVVTLVNMLAGIWRDNALRRDGRREAELKNLQTSMKAIQDDYKIDNLDYSLASIASRLRKRAANPDDNSVPGAGVPDASGLGHADSKRSE